MPTASEMFVAGFQKEFGAAGERKQRNEEIVKNHANRLAEITMVESNKLKEANRKKQEQWDKNLEAILHFKPDMDPMLARKMAENEAMTAAFLKDATAKEDMTVVTALVNGVQYPVRVPWSQAESTRRALMKKYNIPIEQVYIQKSFNDAAIFENKYAPRVIQQGVNPDLPSGLTNQDGNPLTEDQLYVLNSADFKALPEDKKQEVLKKFGIQPQQG